MQDFQEISGISIRKTYELAPLHYASLLAVFTLEVGVVRHHGVQISKAHLKQQLLGMGQTPIYKRKKTLFLLALTEGLFCSAGSTAAM